MIAALLISMTLLVSGVVMDRFLSWRDKRREQRRKQLLELENEEYDYGHNVNHDETRDI